MENKTCYYGILGEISNNITEERAAYYKLIDSLVDQIAEHMVQTEMSRSELASKLGKSRSWITQFLSGDINFSVKIVSEVLDVLNAEMKIKIVPKAQSEGWTWFGVSRKRIIAPTGSNNFTESKIPPKHECMINNLVA